MKVSQHIYNLLRSSDFLFICYFILHIFAIEMPQTLSKKRQGINEKKKETSLKESYRMDVGKQARKRTVSRDGRKQ